MTAKKNVWRHSWPQFDGKDHQTCLTTFRLEFRAIRLCSRELCVVLRGRFESTAQLFKFDCENEKKPSATQYNNLTDHLMGC